VQNESFGSVHQSPAQINIAGFEDPMTVSLPLADARVIASTHQPAATKDLFGVVIVARVADSRG
jgi:hypothetical protein